MIIALEDAKYKLIGMRTDLEDLGSALRITELKTLAEELDAKTLDPDFWSNQENSSKVLQKLKQTKDTIESYEALHREEEELLPDPQIRQIVSFVIGELKEEKKIFCKCPESTEGHYESRIMEDGILVYCKDCGASHIVPVDSYLGAHTFLDCDSLHLE